MTQLVESSERAVAAEADRPALLPAARLGALHDAALAIGRTVGDDPEVATRLVATVVRLAVASLGAAGGAIILAEDPAWSGLVPGTGAAEGLVVLRDNGAADRRTQRPGGTAMRALEGHPVHVAETRDPAHGGTYDWLVASGVRSFTVVPLRAPGGGVVLGALIINFASPGSLSEEDRGVLDLFAAHAAVALERAKRLHAERRRSSQAARMAEVLSRVAASDTVEGVLEQLLRGTMALLGGTSGTVRLVDTETCERLVSVDVAVESETEAGEAAARWTRTRKPLEPGTFGALLACGSGAVLVDDFASLSTSYPLRDEMLRLGRRSAVHIPIDAVGKRIGSVHVNHPQPGYFTSGDVALAEALGALAGEAVERARLAAERAERARLDAALLVARTVAHEINNALAPITGYAELLAMSPKISSDEGLNAYARRILWASLEVAEKVKKLQRIIRLEEQESSLGPGLQVLDLERSTG